MHGSNTIATRNLVVLGCSATKVETEGVLPAVHLYDGPTFRVLRSFLRENRWPHSLSLAVLSAKFGLIGGLAQIPYYNQRMTSIRAVQLGPSVTASLQKLVFNHQLVDLVMGKDYLQSIDLQAAQVDGTTFRFATGAIGMKLNRLHDLLRCMPHQRRRPRQHLRRTQRPLYFLPDWDDFLDVEYDFKGDSFSSLERTCRHEEHSIALMRPERICDGVLVSLAQHLGSKGLLKRIGHTDSESLAPNSVRTHFKLNEDQWAFGDCGAFSYVDQDLPTISVEQAVSLYDLYEFDYGASVDHIPVAEIEQNGKKVRLTEFEKKSRIRLTRRNAESFFDKHREQGADFVPVGIVQGLDAGDYARQIADYIDMGYTHIALGGLVPRSDGEVREIVRKVNDRVRQLRRPPWIHLLGIYRPALQDDFRRCGINSFDSATYFRKAWLRSDQNYLAVDGKWYAAIRVPPTRDARTLIRLKKSGLSERKIKNLEQKALSALRSYDRRGISIADCLKALRAYDSLLTRAATEQKDLNDAYRKTLEAQPWRRCKCMVCRKIGIDVLIFRGLNRNKRRGAHNTLQLYAQLDTPQPLRER
jgi:hypothetical protein